MYLHNSSHILDGVLLGGNIKTYNVLCALSEVSEKSPCPLRLSGDNNQSTLSGFTSGCNRSIAQPSVGAA